jgi:hypothetical protein
MKLPDGATKTFKPSLPGSVKYYWNQAVKEALEEGSDWIFSTHLDIQYVPGTLERLLSWNEPLISALTFMRHNPVTPQVWNKYSGDSGPNYAMRINDTRDWFYKHKEYIRFGPFIMDPKPSNALYSLEEGFTATACTLIHRSVFEDMKKICGEQWFVCDSELGGGGEDRRFYEYARQAGYIPKIDRSCVAGHVAGDIATSSADFIAWDSISTWKETGEPTLPSLEQPQADGGS